MQAPKGTRDFGPKEMGLRRRTEERLRHVLSTFNFSEVQTPTFEELALFTAKSGEGIRKELYAFKDQSGRDLCLRPELTAPVMRFYFSQLKAEPKPLRLFYFGPCFRYDQPQAGRYREFWQLGVEVIGDASPEAHAELLWMALKLLMAAGLEEYRLRIGHLTILRSLLAQLGYAASEQGPLMRIIDKKDWPALAAELTKRQDKKDVHSLLQFFQDPSLDRTKKLSLATDAQQALGALERTLALLQAFGADMGRVAADPTIARGLEYYTGIVFELDCPALGAQKQLLGGGEYDLSGVFDAPATPTLGFGLGFDRTLLALETTGRLEPAEDRVDALVAALSQPAARPAQDVAHRLREAGLRVELDLSGRGAKKALQFASAIQARSAALLGDREIERGVVTVKDLDTGNQVEVTADTIAEHLARRPRREPVALGTHK